MHTGSVSRGYKHTLQYTPGANAGGITRYCQATLPCIVGMPHRTGLIIQMEVQVSTENLGAQLKRRVKVALISAATLAVSASTAMAGATTEQPNSTVETLSVLTSEQRAEDALPSHVDFNNRMDKESARFLADSGAAQHWVAVSHQDEVCLISVLSGTRKSGYSCDSEEGFGQSGLALSLAGSAGEPSTEAYLVPDGYAESSAAATGWTKQTPNLLVSDPDAPEQRPSTVDADDLYLKLTDIPPVRSWDAANNIRGNARQSATMLDYKLHLYAYRQTVDAGLKISSHSVRDGADMVGGDHNVEPIETKIIICGETVSPLPPHHVLLQGCGESRTGYSHGPYWGISRCWWPHDRGDVTLSCRYRF